MTPPPAILAQLRTLTTAAIYAFDTALAAGIVPLHLRADTRAARADAAALLRDLEAGRLTDPEALADRLDAINTRARDLAHRTAAAAGRGVA
jgi:hypothetical protein